MSEGYRVLLVDDNQSNLLTFGGLLEDEGYEVATASSLAEARASLASGAHYDVVLLDFHLDDGEGPEVIPDVRRGSPSALVAVLSGTLGDLEVRGADLVFDKAEDPEKTLAVIGAALRERSGARDA